MLRRIPLLLLTTVVAACATSRGPAAGSAVGVSPGRGKAPNESRESTIVHTATGELGPSTATHDSIAVSLREIMSGALAIFGDTLPTPAAAAPAVVESVTTVALVEDAEPTWDIDVRSYETHDRVQKYVSLFTGSARPTFQRWMQQGVRYMPMIREKLRSKGIPEDMSYLALIESGYSPHAYSRAAAVGMWQFMTRTGRGMGLRIDWWVDERRDPIESTDAAVRFLGHLREQFGSLYLAAAAYNGGPGRVARGLTRIDDELQGQNGDDAFFALADTRLLRAETKDYVPKLIAAALLAKNAKRFGFDVDSTTPFAFDSARVPAATPLMAVARASRTHISVIRDLNPHVLRGMTPPKDSFTVRIPLGRADSFPVLFDSLSEHERRAYTRVVTKKGQTLKKLASQHAVESHEVRWLNPKLRASKAGVLVAGQTVLVPTPNTVEGAFDVPNPDIERYGATGSGRVHVVRRGENLSVIAKRYGTSVSALMRLNGLKKGVIFPGQSIIVRGKARRTARS
ncbi:MAG: transglycosylase SLT domain-containing protein [Gemmatimonadaceae bacterium]